MLINCPSNFSTFIQNKRMIQFDFVIQYKQNKRNLNCITLKRKFKYYKLQFFF